VRTSTLAHLLRLAGLPTLQGPRVEATVVPQLDEAAERLLAGDATAAADLPIPRTEFLRWLAQTRPVLFHGSSREDLALLEPIRLSRDTTEFGDRQAVYATNDPVWAIYFATLHRSKPFSTRNGSLAPAGSDLYPRWYFFSVRAPGGRERFGTGSLYVLPREGFVSQAPLYGAIDTAQWLSPTSVRPIVRLDVAADDFPLRDYVVGHSDREPMLVTWARAGVRARRQRSARR
jgi:hypothetical protein